MKTLEIIPEADEKRGATTRHHATKVLLLLAVS